ncbi:MAG: hypothetical protein IIA72_23945 [Proteobacteria bacterium]|nr:hypothetical protein [Pseudomonadota bacterium]
MSDRENDGSERPPAHEEVGYGKPPTRRRFKKSGNSKGRPKGSKNRKTIVKAVANEMHSVLENGKRRRRSTLDLVLLRLRNMALEEGNDRAFEELHRLIKAYQPQATNDDAGCLVVPAEMTQEEWIAEQMEKNKHRQRPSGCKP